MENETKKLVEFGCVQNGFFKRNIYIEKNSDFQAVKEMFINANRNSDLYECIFVHHTMPNDQTYYLGNLCLDFDAEINTEKAYKKLTFEVKKCINFLNTFFSLDYDNYKIYFSGHKGFHLVIPYEIFGIKPSPLLNVSYKNFVLKLINECNLKFVDTKIYDARRLFRIPNTLNTKSKLYKTQINIDQLYNFSLEDMLNWAKQEREIFDVKNSFNRQAAKIYHQYTKYKNHQQKTTTGAFKVPDTKQELLPCAKNLLENGATEGNRNNSTVALTSSLLQSGLSIDETFMTIVEWNQLNTPPLPGQELETTIKSAIKMLDDGKVYGCSSYKDLGACVGKECKILSKIS